MSDSRLQLRALINTPLGQVDVLQGLPAVPIHAELEGSAVQVDMDDLSVRVCSLDHLLAMKQATDRALDAADVVALRTAHPDGDLES